MRCRGLIALLVWGQSVAAADLGTWGDLWPVKEPDMLTVIMQGSSQKTENKAR